MGGEQLLGAAGHGEGAINEAIDAIVRAAETTVQGARRPEEGGQEPARESVPAAAATTPSPAPASAMAGWESSPAETPVGEAPDSEEGEDGRGGDVDPSVPGAEPAVGDGDGVPSESASEAAADVEPGEGDDRPQPA